MTSKRNPSPSRHRAMWAIGILGLVILVILVMMGCRAEALMPMIPCLILLAYSLMRLVNIVQGNATNGMTTK